MEGELKIVSPVMSLVSIAGQDRVVEKDLEAVEVGAKAVEHDDVWRNDQKIANTARRGRANRMSFFMEPSISLCDCEENRFLLSFGLWARDL